jgi:hypothetical protein
MDLADDDVARRVRDAIRDYDAARFIWQRGDVEIQHPHEEEEKP